MAQKNLFHKAMVFISCPSSGAIAAQLSTRAAVQDYIISTALHANQNNKTTTTAVAYY